MPTKTLEAALKTADPLTIFAALDALVRMSPSVSKLAKDAGADRSMLYRAFRREKGPRLSLVVKVLSSAGFQLIVNADGKRPQNDRPNRKGQATKTTAHLELSSNPKASAKFFTGAFETSDTVTIVRALDDTLRAQENVVQFSRRASLWRSSIYRSFSGTRDPQFSTVVHFLRALGLRFAVVPLSPSSDARATTAPRPGSAARFPHRTSRRNGYGGGKSRTSR
jgi:probable addiction module antidote protein